ncbi:hypothetical protein [Arcobacter sp. LA11]|uniref:hypothetical protein n=1 Tax=Arcobacter sp. LA11 TaxID=1898176 RepID=UPI0009347F38|nr:hypothetical protein [Arcobacter sp. LA11]
MRNLLSILFIISIIFITITNAYDTQKGKIDMHGGKGDALRSGNAFDVAVGLGAVLNKKGSDKIKDDKKFIPLEEKETIQKIDHINK